ncbi:MAG: methylmalonyl Co-A mutase-associated GTPase MeaB [Candidatus Aureabacteria bacterium]|nr:methylmalonyl Co-A mutase-associated GTPase MeaB [Candidatus Auribacterota bacterium]
MAHQQSPNHSTHTLAQGVLRREPRAASRLLSWIENGDAKAIPELKEIYPHSGSSYIVGVTGAPGSGKSTLTDRLISLYRSQGQRVGVLAIDPSSPFSGGAVLGDRIRMQRHATDEGVFIRSMANRNWPGGLNRCTAEALKVLEAYGSDIVIVETVGVGQSEVEVEKLAYTTILVCTPDAGDKIQAMKAGIIEIADIVALNKADLPTADHAAKSIEMILSMNSSPGWTIPFLKTVAIEGKGVEELAQAIERHRSYIEEHGILKAKKIDSLKSHIREIIRRELYEKVRMQLPDEDELSRCAAKLMEGTTDPYTIADAFLKERRMTL